MTEVQELLIGGIPFTVSAGMRWLHTTRDRALGRRHCNAEYEVTLILQGSCQIDVTDTHFTLSEGCGIIIPPGDFHYFKNDPAPFDRFTFRFTLTESALARTIRTQLPQYRIFSVPGDISTLCQNLFQLYETRPMYWQELYAVQLKTLLLRILSLLELGTDTSGSYLFLGENSRASYIDRYIEDHLADAPSVDDLAKHLHLSRRQTVRILQDIYGIGFREKLLFARMDRAAWLLRTTKEPLSQIIGAVGYSSQTAFHRAFQSHFHMTPLQYRKESDAAT